MLIAFREKRRRWGRVGGREQKEHAFPADGRCMDGTPTN